MNIWNKKKYKGINKKIKNNDYQDCSLQYNKHVTEMKLNDKEEI